MNKMIENMKAWLSDAAGYFERRPTDGEDMAHWANVYNAENGRKISKLLDDLKMSEERFDAAINTRNWFHYPIVMPVNAEEQGPCDLAEAVKLTWEVWDQELTSHASFEFLPDAINEAMRLNREKK